MGANAQTSVPVFTAGQVLTAVQQTQINTGIPVFATTTTRDAAFGGTGEKTLAEGQMCYLESTKATQFYNGTAWKNIFTPWTSFTPTWTSGFTAGNATQTWNYQIVGDVVTVIGRTVLGSTSSVSGNPTFTLPITRDSSGIMSLGFGTFQDTGTATFQNYPVSTSNTSCTLFGVLVNGTWAQEGTVGATGPFIWTTNDVIGVNITYAQA
jgi:hypothetical protein